MSHSKKKVYLRPPTSAGHKLHPYIVTYINYHRWDMWCHFSASKFFFVDPNIGLRRVKYYYPRGSINTRNNIIIIPRQTGAACSDRVHR